MTRAGKLGRILLAEDDPRDIELTLWALLNEPPPDGYRFTRGD